MRTVVRPLFDRLMLLFACSLVMSACSDTGVNPSTTGSTIDISAPGAQLASGILIGGGVNLSAVVRSGAGEVVPAEFTWQTTAAHVATVDGNGVVRGVGAGSAQIIARTGALSAQITITVLSQVLPVTVSTFSPVNFGRDSLTFSGVVSATSAPTVVGFKYGETPGGLSNVCNLSVAPAADGLPHQIQCTARGLRAGTRVFYDAYAQASNGTAIGDTASGATFVASPPSGRLLVTRSETALGAGRSNIYFVRADGTGILPATTDGTSDMGDISPDGSSLVFRRYPFAGTFSSTGDLVISDVGTGIFRLVARDRDLAYPRWSPDGQRIASISLRDSGLYVMAKDGTGLTLLRTLPGNLSGGVSWSPDGRKIVLGVNGASIAAADRGVYVINSDGTGLTRVLSTPDNALPRWAPNGTFIAVTSASGRVSIVRPDGSGAKVLASDGSALASAPAWSPDGQYLAYVRAGGDAFLTIGLDGITVTQVNLPLGASGGITSWRE